jgi:hypothetical protein
MQQSWMRRPFGNSYVYLRYRCSNCKRLNECYIKEDEWNVRALFDAASEASEDELRRFAEMGPITPDEMQRVRARLVTLRELPRAGDAGISGEGRRLKDEG